MTPSPVRVEAIDLRATFPWLRIFRSFRMAIDPPKLGLALLLVVLLFVLGKVMDAAWGERVFPDELPAYSRLTVREFASWREVQRSEARRQEVRRQLASHLRAAGVREGVDELADNLRFSAATAAIRASYKRQMLELIGQSDKSDAERQRRLRDRLRDQQQESQQRVEAVRALRSRGVFDASLELVVGAIEDMLDAATDLNFGLSELKRPASPMDPTSATVVGSLRRLLVTFPGWLWQTHASYMIVYGLATVGIAALLGGAIARLAAVQATRGRSDSHLQALRFAKVYWVWFILTPLIPLGLVLALGLVMALGGLATFNVPALDILGSLVFFLAILAGLLVALTLIGLAGASGLLFPAIAVEGSDAFDALSRSGSYLIGRPWHWAFFNFLAMVYGGITYFFVGAVVFLALKVTHGFVGAWVVREPVPLLNAFEAVMPAPRVGDLTYAPDLSQLPWSLKAAAVVVSVWVNLFIALLAAYAISYFFCSQTWVYLLLRRAADGTEFEELFDKPLEEPPTDAAPTEASPPQTSPPDTASTPAQPPAPPSPMNAAESPQD